MCSSRSTTTASVGVCTRPTVVRKKPPSRELKAVIARVPLMPTSQSASERERAASARPCICSLLRSAAKPSRIACGVIDCSHSRCTGLPSGFFAARVLLDQAEDQLALAPGVAGVDELAHVLALGLADHGVQPGLGLVHRLQVEVRRNHRQVREAPLAALHVELFGRLDFQQVPDGARDDVLVVLEMVFVLVELAGHRRERAHDVLRHRRLFCNHQSFRIEDFVGVWGFFFSFLSPAFGSIVGPTPW